MGEPELEAAIREALLECPPGGSWCPVIARHVRPLIEGEKGMAFLDGRASVDSEIKIVIDAAVAKALEPAIRGLEQISASSDDPEPSYMEWAQQLARDTLTALKPKGGK